MHLYLCESQETIANSDLLTDSVECTLPTPACYLSLVEPSMGYNPTGSYPIGVWTRPGPLGNNILIATRDKAGGSRGAVYLFKGVD